MVGEIATKRTEALWFKGTLVKILVGAADGREDISVVEHRMPYGEAPPLHVHRNEDEIFHVLEGTMRFHVGGQQVTAGAGETLVAPKGVPHGFRVESVSGARCLTIVRGRNFETLIRTFGAPAIADELPPMIEPAPEMIEALSYACAENGIDIIGAPIA
jgi:quercetin dioxygenase-like cupin family protein